MNLEVVAVHPVAGILLVKGTVEPGRQRGLSVYCKAQQGVRKIPLDGGTTCTWIGDTLQTLHRVALHTAVGIIAVEFGIVQCTPVSVRWNRDGVELVPRERYTIILAEHEDGEVVDIIVMDA